MALATNQSEFGRLLCGWRAQRGLSQLALAHTSDVSQRHISFLESGRSTPSRDMVLRLCDALNVPLRMRNALLTSAGYAPMFTQRALDSEELGPFKYAIDALLGGVEPSPALLVNGSWDMLQANAGAQRFFAYLLGPERMLVLSGEPRVNVMHWLFRDDALKPFVVDWEQAASHLLQRVHRDASVQGGGDGPLKGLIDELLAYPGVPENWRVVRWDLDLPPALVMTFATEQGPASFHATVTSIGTPYDITLDDLRVETFFAANAETADLLKHLRPQ